MFASVYAKVEEIKARKRAERRQQAFTRFEMMSHMAALEEIGEAGGYGFIDVDFDETEAAPMVRFS